MVITTRLTGPRVVLSTPSPTDCNEKCLRHRSLWNGNLNRPLAFGGIHSINKWTPWGALISCRGVMKWVADTFTHSIILLLYWCATVVAKGNVWLLMADYIHSNILRNICLFKHCHGSVSETVEHLILPISESCIESAKSFRYCWATHHMTCYCRVREKLFVG